MIKVCCDSWIEAGAAWWAYKSKMEFPTVINWASPFRLKGCWVVVFIIIQILREHSVCKPWRSWSDATFCGIWSGFAYVQQKGRWAYVGKSIYAKWNFILISIGPIHFHFKGCLVVVFIFIQILLEHSESKP